MSCGGGIECFLMKINGFLLHHLKWCHLRGVASGLRLIPIISAVERMLLLHRRHCCIWSEVENGKKHTGLSQFMFCQYSFVVCWAFDAEWLFIRNLTIWYRFICIEANWHYISNCLCSPTTIFKDELRNTCLQRWTMDSSLEAIASKSVIPRSDVRWEDREGAFKRLSSNQWRIGPSLKVVRAVVLLKEWSVKGRMNRCNHPRRWPTMFRLKYDGVIHSCENT